jgi:hypothetical protein
LVWGQAREGVATRSNIDPTKAVANSAGQVLNPGANVANYGKGKPESSWTSAAGSSESIEGGNARGVKQINIFRGGNWTSSSSMAIQ